MQLWFITLPYFHWIQGKTFSYHEMRFEKDSRYYLMRLEKDLFDNWTISVINGSIKSKLGQSRTFAYDDYEKAFENFCLFVTIRNQQKYHLVSYKTRNSFFLHCLIFLLNTADSNKRSPQNLCITNSRRAKKKPSTNLSNSKSNPYDNNQISFDF